MMELLTLNYCQVNIDSIAIALICIICKSDNKRLHKLLCNICMIIEVP
jgi:hypothetical protein